jgi:hypothetical protein
MDIMNPDRHPNPPRGAITELTPILFSHLHVTRGYSGRRRHLLSSFERLMHILNIWTCHSFHSIRPFPSLTLPTLPYPPSPNLRVTPSSCLS